MRLLFTFFYLLGIVTIAQTQTLHTIEAGSFFYRPDSLTIEVGDTVRWLNLGGFHNVNAESSSITGTSFNNPESFVSDATTSGELLTRIFTVAGTYEYDCSVGSHAENGMVAMLKVVNTVTSTNDIREESISRFDVRYSSSSNVVDATFQLSKTPGNAHIGLSDLSGRNLAYEKIPAVAGNNTQQIRLEIALSAGIYLVSLYVDGFIKTEKIFIP